MILVIKLLHYSLERAATFVAKVLDQLLSPSFEAGARCTVRAAERRREYIHVGFGAASMPLKLSTPLTAHHTPRMQCQTIHFIVCGKFETPKLMPI